MHDTPTFCCDPELQNDTKIERFRVEMIDLQPKTKDKMSVWFWHFYSMPRFKLSLFQNGAALSTASEIRDHTSRPSPSASAISVRVRVFSAVDRMNSGFGGVFWLFVENSCREFITTAAPHGRKFISFKWYRRFSGLENG